MKGQTVYEAINNGRPTEEQCEKVCQSRLDPSINHLLCHPCSYQEYHNILEAEQRVNHEEYSFLFEFNLAERIDQLIFATHLPVELLYILFCIFMQRYFTY
jgi:hypothetical protein